MVGRVRSMGILRTGDPALDRVQDHVKQQLDPVLQNTLLSAVDFRWIEVQGADAATAPTFALQYRSASTQGVAPTWSTIATWNSATGDMSIAASKAGDLLYASAAGTAGRLAAGTNGQILTLASGLPAWAGETSWTAFPYGANWSDFAGGNQIGGYLKDAAGFVHLRGLTKDAAGVGGAGITIGTLPAGYRPSATETFTVANYNGATFIGGIIQVTSTGVVQTFQFTNGGAGTSGMALDGVTFDTRS